MFFYAQHQRAPPGYNVLCFNSLNSLAFFYFCHNSVAIFKTSGGFAGKQNKNLKRIEPLEKVGFPMRTMYNVSQTTGCELSSSWVDAVSLK